MGFLELALGGAPIPIWTLGYQLYRRRSCNCIFLAFCVTALTAFGFISLALCAALLALPHL